MAHNHMAEDEYGCESSPELTNNATSKLCLANREINPKVLINDIVQFCKIHHEYTIVDIQGPAHKKTFYVKLKLAEEEYSAAGESIKKAKQAAAAIALAKTKYPRPPFKLAHLKGRSSSSIPDSRKFPLVHEIALRRNMSVNFEVVSGPPHMKTFKTKCAAKLLTEGDGNSRQASKERAAELMLKELWKLPPSSAHACPRQLDTNVIPVASPSHINTECIIVDMVTEGDGRSKEASKKRATEPVVIPEASPSHMENVNTECIIVDMVTEGDGGSKEASKKRAAEPVVIPEAGPSNKKNIKTECKVAGMVTEGDVNSEEAFKKRAAEPLGIPKVSPSHMTERIVAEIVTEGDVNIKEASKKRAGEPMVIPEAGPSHMKSIKTESKKSAVELIVEGL